MNKPATDLESEAATPPLKWAGGKRWLVPTLAVDYRKFSTYRLVEPFVGGMSVALGLMPKTALLNDTNPHLINFYQQVKKGFNNKILMENSEELFYQHRERLNELIRLGQADSIEAANLFYYLNRTCFNGLCRFNNKGEFNVPFGRYSKISYKTNFKDLQKLLNGWELSCGDFEQLRIGRNDFLYVDPPYDVEFTKYSKNDFTWKDQERLVEWLIKFNNPMVVSNQATERIIKLYTEAGFEVEEIEAPRRIAASGDRTPAIEMLAVRNLKL